MELSPSWEANWSAASQEIPRILWNPKVHHRTHKRTPPVHILSYLHPVHTPTSDFPKIHPNIILPSTPGSPQWSPYLRFPHQNPVHISPLPHTRYMPRPTHSSIIFEHRRILKTGNCYTRYKKYVYLTDTVRLSDKKSIRILYSTEQSQCHVMAGNIRKIIVT